VEYSLSTHFAATSFSFVLLFSVL
jgi:hypothetical protein